MNISQDNNEKLKQKLNKYIRDNCICDGLGPLDGFSDMGKFSGLTNNDVSMIVKIVNTQDTKPYACNWCDEEQVFKDSQLERRQLGDRMATGLYGLCAFCHKEHIMIPLGDSKSTI